jgi:hypothetical protein
MPFTTRSLSPQESRVVLALAEDRKREATRAEILRVLGSSAQASRTVNTFMYQNPLCEGVLIHI